MQHLHAYFEKLYACYNHRRFVIPDPLQFLYDYDDLQDREIVALIAATLAYGRVAQILKSVAAVLDRLGPSPAAFLRHSSPQRIRKAVSGLKHRFTSEKEIGSLLVAVKHVIAVEGSLYRCFRSGIQPEDGTILPALDLFVQRLAGSAGGLDSFTLPLPRSGSACKRLNLFLRWMIRQDAVDPGGWEHIAPSLLVIPLDTHMFRIGHALGFTSRRQADLRAAVEITGGFSRIIPGDPVRYDFSLTRFGIRRDFAGEDILCSIDAIRSKTLQQTMR